MHTRDETGRLTAQKRNDAPEIGRVTDDAGRNAERGRIGCAAVHLSHPVGGVHAGLHGVHRDSVGGNFAGEFAYSTTADDTYLLVYDYTAASMKRVSRGASDSGGAGFRLLRIPN
jgi:hypothetical protein